LLLAEAFITASGKPEPLPAGQHAADAVAAGLALVEILDISAPLVSSVCCWPRESLSLRAAMALWAGCGLIPVSYVRRSSSLPRAPSMGHRTGASCMPRLERMDDLA